MDLGAFRAELGLEVHGTRKTAEDMRQTYAIQEELGKGAYGTVVKALHRKRQLVFAIKHIDKKTAGSKGIREVMNEVETMQLLVHPHIVHLEEVYQDQDNLWIVMDYVRGGELHSLLKQRGKFSENAVRRIAWKVLLALDYIHEKGLVHRDLKPANLLVSEYGDGNMDVKLADFGFAVMVGDSHCLTSFCGTMAYMAPEVVMDRNYGRPVDLWALGVMVFLLLTGEYPFMSSNPDDLPNLICKCEYDLEGPLWKDVSAAAKDFISKLLVVDDSKRLSAKQGLRHYWLRPIADGSDGTAMMEDSLQFEPGAMDSPGTAQKILRAKAESRRKKLRGTFKAGIIAVLAAHRFVFLARLHSLARDGLEQPVLKSFPFLVSRRFEPRAPYALSGRGECNGQPKALAQLVAMLEAGPRVETFDIGNNSIDSLELIQGVAKACTTHPSLTALHLDNNPIPALAGRTLQRLARSAPKLKLINVAGTNIGSDQATQIAQALREAEKRRAEAASVGATSAPSTQPPRPNRLTSPASGTARTAALLMPTGVGTGAARHAARSRSGRR